MGPPSVTFELKVGEQNQLGFWNISIRPTSGANSTHWVFALVKGIKSNQITLIQSFSRGVSDPIYNNMNTLNTKLFKL